MLWMEAAKRLVGTRFTCMNSDVHKLYTLILTTPRITPMAKVSILLCLGSNHSAGEIEISGVGENQVLERVHVIWSWPSCYTLATPRGRIGCLVERPGARQRFRSCLSNRKDAMPANTHLGPLNFTAKLRRDLVGAP